MTQGMVISLMMIAIEMDDRGSKSNAPWGSFDFKNKKIIFYFLNQT